MSHKPGKAEKTRTQKHCSKPYESSGLMDTKAVENEIQEMQKALKDSGRYKGLALAKRIAKDEKLRNTYGLPNPHGTYETHPNDWGFKEDINYFIKSLREIAERAVQNYKAYKNAGPSDNKEELKMNWLSEIRALLNRIKGDKSLQEVYERLQIKDDVQRKVKRKYGDRKDLKKKFEQKKEVLKNMELYAPGGEGYLESKSEWETYAPRKH